eukprot:TRINITY_DN2653_c0_g1_i1.p2 TRINITY_DN2653_c0_g1~~TRINITY_DN2653_c0_g1_i1.p2  ORF type:complete len:869 (+),score=114.32 TRINITY_DN2653_c0_g1_i1:1605-4211(+)
MQNNTHQKQTPSDESTNMSTTPKEKLPPQNPKSNFKAKSRKRNLPEASGCYSIEKFLTNGKAHLAPAKENVQKREELSKEKLKAKNGSKLASCPTRKNIRLLIRTIENGKSKKNDNTIKLISEDGKVCQACQAKGTLFKCEGCGLDFHSKCMDSKKSNSILCKSCRHVFILWLDSHSCISKPKKAKKVKKDDANEAFKLFKETYPECVKGNKIVYPIDDALLRAMPELHGLELLPKPISEPVPGGEEHAADLLEIWNFCRTFKTMLGVPNFSLSELYTSMTSSNDEESYLVTYLVQSLIDTYVKDVKEFSEKELYSTFAILLLELSDYLHLCPVEASALVFRVKKYRRCIAPPVLELVHSVAIKYETQGIETKLCNVPFKEKKEIILELVRGLCIASKAKDCVSKTIQEQKDFKQVERHKNILEKEVQPLKVEEGVELPPEKKKEALAKQREINKLESTLKKKQKMNTEKLGVDADSNEYWIFTGDKEHIYTRTFDGEKEKWGYYSTKEQADKLLASLSDKGILEHKLKIVLTKTLPNLKLTEPVTLEEAKNIPPPLPYKDRLRGNKKKVAINREPQMATVSSLVAYLLQCEEKYHEFFRERSLLWEPSPSRRALWRSKGVECKELVVVRKWFLEFALNAMKPSLSGPLPKPIRSAIRITQDYEFDPNSVSDEDNEDSEEFESKEDRISLRGVIWKDLGKDVFDKWLEYAKTSRNANELLLCCKLLNRLLEESYQCIKDVEKEKKPTVQASNGLRQAKLRCMRTLKEKPVYVEDDYSEESQLKPMEIEWEDVCYKCGEGGELLCCDTCPNVAHFGCVGLQKAPSGMWQCENCENKSIMARQTRSKTKRLQKLAVLYEGKEDSANAQQQ